MTGTGEGDRRMSTRGLCELTLESRDHRALARFSQEALGLPLLAEEDDRVWLACGPNARLGPWSVGAKEFGDRGGRHVHFALSVSHGELDDVARRMRRLGTPSRGGRTSTTEATVAVLRGSRRRPRRGMDYFENGDGANDGVAALT